MDDQTKEIVNDRILDEVMSSDLKEEEKLFVLYYLESYNATQSYLKAFKGRKESSARVRAFALLHRKDIKAQIKKLKKLFQIGYDIDPSRYVEFLIKGANSNIGDYLSFAEEEVQVRGKDGSVLVDFDTGEPLKKKISRVRFKNSDNLDLSLVESVKQGRDGISIQLVDKVKCWEKLKEFMEWKMQKEENEKIGTNIIEAINNSAKNVWEKGKEDEDLEEILNG